MGSSSLAFRGKVFCGSQRTKEDEPECQATAPGHIHYWNLRPSEG